MKSDNDIHTNLEALVLERSFRSLGPEEQAMVLQEFGSAEAYDCLHFTLNNAGHELQREADELEADPAIFDRLHTRMLRKHRFAFLQRLRSGLRFPRFEPLMPVFRWGLACSCIVALMLLAAGADFLGDSHSGREAGWADSSRNDKGTKILPGPYADSGKEYKIDSIISLDGPGRIRQRDAQVVQCSYAGEENSAERFGHPAAQQVKGAAAPRHIDLEPVYLDRLMENPRDNTLVYYCRSLDAGQRESEGRATCLKRNMPPIPGTFAA